MSKREPPALERHRDAVGVPLAIVHQARYKPTDAIPGDSGVFFTTYTMPSADFGADRRRFKQLTDWLGPDFDGVIALNEAHLMKNAAATLPRAPTAAPAPRLRRLKHPLDQRQAPGITPAARVLPRLEPV